MPGSQVGKQVVELIEDVAARLLDEAFHLQTHRCPSLSGGAEVGPEA